LAITSPFQIACGISISFASAVSWLDDAGPQGDSAGRSVSLLELFAQLHAGAMDAALGSGERDLERLGDFFVGEAFNVAEHERCPILERQLANPLGDEGAQLGGFGSSCSCLRRSFINAWLVAIRYSQVETDDSPR
jgi:hypothetical protein